MTGVARRGASKAPGAIDRAAGVGRIRDKLSSKLSLPCMAAKGYRSEWYTSVSCVARLSGFPFGPIRSWSVTATTIPCDGWGFSVAELSRQLGAETVEVASRRHFAY